MTRRWIALFTVVVVMLLPLAFAIPTSDVRVRSEQDEKRNTIYKLVNTGSKGVKATVQYQKSGCSGQSNNRKPTERNYWVDPGASVQLRKVMASSSCRHEFRVVRASYY